ncbi:interferon-inducible GTPase 1-like [Ruditapes philippinarum]|uniref:interferon-inducible GTPase 1-like n=1 Tax=Ruditapes philippinarum TaxID=129788 RepID=UPI00295C1ED2|nr:interferon-inducible GTPase 1-like [Ruditapes philippinarum]
MAACSVNITKTSDEIDDALEIEKELKLHPGSMKGQSMKINIAVIGQPKSGKSSVINRLKNVSSTKTGAAVVDDSVTNNRVMKYDFPENPNVNLWELPGQKIQDTKQITDRNAIGFDRYDFFLILSEKSFMESDNWFIKEVLQKRKPCFFVRTCIRRCVDGTKLATLRKNKSQVLEEIRNNCKLNLKTYEVTDPKIFLVDTDDSFNNFFEFEDLKDQLLLAAESAKIGDIPFSFNLKHTDDVMNLQKEFLERRIKEKGLLASTAKTIGERKEILKREILSQQEVFGMDKSSLAKYQTEYNLPKGLIGDFTIEFDKRYGSSGGNVIRFDKVDDSRRTRSVSTYFRRASDFVLEVKGSKGATYICKQCIKILEDSLQMIYSLREKLNKEVMSHLVTKKRNDRESEMLGTNIRRH